MDPARRTRAAGLLMVGAMLAFAALDGLRKALSKDVAASLIVATRYVVFALVVAFWLSRRGRTVLTSGHPWLQLVRAVVMATEAIVFVYALRYASLADANAAFAFAPVAGVLLAVLLLAERAGRSTWIALAVSFGGIAIILRPGAHSRPLGLWLAFGSALLYALYGVLTRAVSDRDDARTSFCFMTLGGLAVVGALGVFQAPHWAHPSGRDVLFLVLAALAAAVGQYLLILAYSLAPAGPLQPYNYFLFAWSVPISIVFFGTPPSTWAIAGTVLVIGAGVYLFANPAETDPGAGATQPLSAPPPG
jgi:drug/metabolite transporter (DMT)-like permease